MRALTQRGVVGATDECLSEWRVSSRGPPRVCRSNEEMVSGVDLWTSERAAPVHASGAHVSSINVRLHRRTTKNHTQKAPTQRHTRLSAHAHTRRWTHVRQLGLCPRQDGRTTVVNAERERQLCRWRGAFSLCTPDCCSCGTRWSDRFAFSRTAPCKSCQCSS